MSCCFTIIFDRIPRTHVWPFTHQMAASWSQYVLCSSFAAFFLFRMKDEYKNAVLIKPNGSNVYAVSYGYKTRLQSAEVLSRKKREVDDDREPDDTVNYFKEDLSLDYQICIEGWTPMQCNLWICRVMKNICYPYKGESDKIEMVRQYDLWNHICIWIHIHIQDKGAFINYHQGGFFCLYIFIAN